ncbi:MAG: hypothetical protein ACKVHU_20265 [Acidimicrobiales bacterium]
MVAEIVEVVRDVPMVAVEADPTAVIAAELTRTVQMIDLLLETDDRRP